MTMPSFSTEPSSEHKESVEQAGNLAALQLQKALEIATANKVGTSEVLAAILNAIASNHAVNMTLLLEQIKRSG
jgi:hypothetical protein